VVYLLNGVEAAAKRDLRTQITQGVHLWHEVALAHEPESQFLDVAFDLFWLAVDADSQGLQHIADGHAKLRTDAFLAVEHDRHARRRRHDGRRRADDDTVLAAVVGAA